MRRCLFIRNIVAKLLILVLSFVIVHDSVYASISMFSNHPSSELESDCNQSESNEFDACQCPLHVLEKCKTPLSVHTQFEFITDKEVLIRLIEPDSYISSIIPPPPKS